MLISILVILILFILLFVGLFQSMKTWSWTNIIFVFLTFVMGVFAAYSGSQVLKARHAWMSIAKENAKQARENKDKYFQALNGPNEALTFPLDSLRGAEFEVSRITTGKGRIWSGGTVTNQGDDAVIEFESDNGSGASQLKQDTIVYALQEQVAGDAAPIKFATTFVGTFQVTGSAGDQVTLKPIFISEFGKSEFSTPQSTWALYERMPVDDAGSFKAHAGIAEGKLDIDRYRALLTSEYLPAQLMGLDPESQQYEQLIDSYTFDGLQMGEIKNWIASQNNRKSEFDPDVEDLFVRMRFPGPSQAFQVDAVGNASETAFNQQGQAVDRALHHGSDIKFVKDDEITVPKVLYQGYQIQDPSGANINVPPLQDTIPAERVGGDEADIYRRPLRDYPHLLTKTTQQIATFEREFEEIKGTTTVTEVALSLAEAQQVVRTKKQSNLESDLANYGRDLTIVSARVKQVTQEVERQDNLIQTYYKQVLKMLDEMSDSN